MQPHKRRRREQSHSGDTENTHQQTSLQDERQKLTTKTDWEKILNDETTNVIYNKKLQEITNTNEDNNDT